MASMKELSDVATNKAPVFRTFRDLSLDHVILISEHLEFADAMSLARSSKGLWMGLKTFAYRNYMRDYLSQQPLDDIWDDGCSSDEDGEDYYYTIHWNPLTWAIEMSHPKHLIEDLIEAFGVACPGILLPRRQKSPLFLAAKYGRIELFQSLIDRGCDQHAMVYTQHPFRECFGSREGWSLWSEKDIPIPPGYYNILSAAIYGGQEDLALALIQRSALSGDGLINSTALVAAIAADSPTVIQALFDSGCLCGTRQSLLDEALILAVCVKWEQGLDVVRKLLSLGGTNTRDDQRAWEAAVGCRNGQLAVVLLEHRIACGEMSDRELAELLEQFSGIGRTCSVLRFLLTTVPDPGYDRHRAALKNVLSKGWPGNGRDDRTPHNCDQVEEMDNFRHLASTSMGDGELVRFILFERQWDVDMVCHLASWSFRLDTINERDGDGKTLLAHALDAHARAWVNKTLISKGWNVFEEWAAGRDSVAAMLELGADVNLLDARCKQQLQHYIGCHISKQDWRRIVSRPVLQSLGESQSPGESQSSMRAQHEEQQQRKKKQLRLFAVGMGESNFPGKNSRAPKRPLRPCRHCRVWIQKIQEEDGRRAEVAPALPATTDTPHTR